MKRSTRSLPLLLLPVLLSVAANTLGQEAAQSQKQKTPSQAVPDNWDGFTEHMGQHYGLLIAYYRATGGVPPESRPKK